MGHYFRIRKETDEIFMNVISEVGHMTRAQVDLFFKSLADWSDYTINDFLRVKTSEKRLIVSDDGNFVKFRYSSKKNEFPDINRIKVFYILLDYVRSLKDINTTRCSRNDLSIISEGQEYTFIYISVDTMESSLNYYSKRYEDVKKKLLESGKYEVDSPVVRTIDGTYVFVFDDKVNRDIAMNTLDTFCKDIPYNAIFLESDDYMQYMDYDIVDNEEQFLA